MNDPQFQIRQAGDRRMRGTWWSRFRPLLQKEMRETLRDKRTIGTLFLMPILVYPIISLLMQNFLPKNLPQEEVFGFRVLFEDEVSFNALQGPLAAADYSLRAEARLNRALPQRRNFSNLLGSPSSSDPTRPPDPLERELEGKADSNGSVGRETRGDLTGPMSRENRTSGSQVSQDPEDLELSQHSWNSNQSDADLEDLVRAGEVDLAVRLIDSLDAADSSGLLTPPSGIPPPASQDLDAVRPDTRSTDPLASKAIQLIYDPTQEYSRRAANFISLRIERANLIRSNRLANQMNAPTLSMLSRLETAVAQPSVAVTGLATFIPLILIMMTITGAVYPAIDLTAGERERGTLESLVAAPVSRLGVLTAKYMAVWVVAMLTATLNVASMLITMWVFQLDTLLLGADGITFTLVVSLFVLLGFFAMFFSAILLVVTSIARSFKEAQAYLIPLMMFSLAPGVLALMPNLGSGLWLSLVPMVNLVLLARDVMLGDVQPVFFALAMVSTILYAIAALSVAANVFGSDAVLYGSEGNWQDLWRPNHGQSIPSPAFAFLILAVLFPIQFVLLGLMGRWQQALTPLSAVFLIALATAALFLVIPGLAVRLRRYSVRESFAIRWPKWQFWVGGIFLGCTLWPFVGLSLWGLSQATAWFSEGQPQAWSERILQLATQQVANWSSIPLWILLPCLAVVPAVCEEVFFRGLLLQTLRKETTFWRAILASGLAFGLFHFIVESSVAPLRFVVTSVLGFVLGWVCLKSRSILPGILLHSINNAILMSLALFKDQLQTQAAVQSPDIIKVTLVLGVCFLIATLGFLLIAYKSKRIDHAMAIPTALITALLWFGTAANIGVSQAGCYPWVNATQDDLPAVAEGWTITRFADDRMAHDIHCLTTGPDNEVFVAGPGFIAQLIDDNEDGIADRRQDVNFRPTQGAQGLLVERDFIWAVVDQAIWKIPRNDGSTALKFLDLPKTGGEHDFHAMRRGDDGYLYFVAGNHSQIDQRWVTSPVPIARPRAGVLGRISPDGNTRQILVDGMRNTYDFAFGLDHSFLLYDSDDERDVGMPWYRPTALFRATEGQDIGWESRCYKRPYSVMGAATLLCETGRGSPTGVATLHSADWGAAYLGAAVFADWTFGRVYLLDYRNMSSSTQKTVSQHAEAKEMILVQSRDNVAFAPTDLEFDRQGNLYISVGGRDTSGAVYCVHRSESQPSTVPLSADGNSTNGRPTNGNQTDSDQTNAQPSDVPGAVVDADVQLVLAIVSRWERSHSSSVAQRSALVPDLLEMISGIEGQNNAQALVITMCQDLRRRMLRFQTLGLPTSELIEQVPAILERATQDAGQPTEAEVLIWLAMRSASLRRFGGEVLAERPLPTPQLTPSTSGDRGTRRGLIEKEILAQTVRPSDELWNELVTSSVAVPNVNAAAVLAALALQDAAIPKKYLTSHLAPRDAAEDKFNFDQTWLDLMISDLQAIGKQQSPLLRPDDWVLICRWALQAPLQNDSQTGPWDFMARQRSITMPESMRSQLVDAWGDAWVSLSEKCQPSGDDAIPQTTSDAYLQEMQYWLQVELLVAAEIPEPGRRRNGPLEGRSAEKNIDVDFNPMAKRWQQWFDLHASPRSPIDEINAFVHLAAIAKPWPASVNQTAAEFLLQIDQRLLDNQVSQDRNWNQRFADLGSLLLADNPQLQSMLAVSPHWQRPTQAATLILLSSKNQIEPLRQWAKHWDQWAVGQVDETLLRQIEEMKNKWTLNSQLVSDVHELTPVIDSFVNRQRIELRQRQAALQRMPALPKTGESDSAVGETNRIPSTAQVVSGVDWEAGDADRGERLYQQLNCHRCHGKTGRLGPALSGVTRRFAKSDLIETITQPNKNVSDRYRPLLVQLMDGKVVSGIPVYNSTDGLILEDASGKVWQWKKDDIELTAPSQSSLMPSGLMDQASEQDWADLFEYLRTL